MSELNASAVKKMKVADLRSELTKRGLDSKGLKQVLVDRLLEALEDDQPVEMATDVKEEQVESAEESTAVAQNGEAEKTEPIAEVSEQPPEELMAEDTSVSAEQNDKIQVKEEPFEDTEAKDDVKVKEEEPQAMESDSKEDKTVKIKIENDEEKNDSIVEPKLIPEAGEGMYSVISTAISNIFVNT